MRDTNHVPFWSVSRSRSSQGPQPHTKFAALPRCGDPTESSRRHLCLSPASCNPVRRRWPSIPRDVSGWPALSALCRRGPRDGRPNHFPRQPMIILEEDTGRPRWAQFHHVQSREDLAVSVGCGGGVRRPAPSAGPGRQRRVWRRGQETRAQRKGGVRRPAPSAAQRGVRRPAPSAR
jgi:hypothetical protein